MSVKIYSVNGTPENFYKQDESELICSVCEAPVLTYMTYLEIKNEIVCECCLNDYLDEHKHIAGID